MDLILKREMEDTNAYNGHKFKSRSNMLIIINCNSPDCQINCHKLRKFHPTSNLGSSSFDISHCHCNITVIWMTAAIGISRYKRWAVIFQNTITLGNTLL